MKRVALPRAVGPGGAQWSILAAALCGIVLLCVWLHPDYQLYDCGERYLPSVQPRFGFRGGSLRVPNRDYDSYGLAYVDPQGPLGRAGFRSGDLPVDHHGGLGAFCGAIMAAERGENPEVTVINVSEYDYAKRRLVRIPPMRLDDAVAR